MQRLTMQVIVLSAAILVYGSSARGQQEKQSSGGRNVDSAMRSVQGPSELTKSNLNRVAASAGQLREVFLKDPGLMVELKRWMAKQAADYGQVVEDENLTDQAVFDRLEHDVEFRSLATILVQRYGYLTPILNPESDLGKQQQLVLQARAKRMVQEEAQEEAASIQAEKTFKASDQQNQCEESGCEERAREKRRPDAISPQYPPDVTTPDQPSLPASPFSPNGPRTIRTDSGSAQPGFAEGLARQQPEAGGLTNAKFGMGATGSLDAAASGLSPAMINSILSGQSNVPPDLLAAGLTKNNSNDQIQPKQSFASTRRQTAAHGEEDLAPVRMVHRSNPYADVPALYDMYVQASIRQKPVERFGLQVFRSSSDSTEAIPMDLPVSPDYVVGPGDGLAIDLWGATSLRMTRTVDRQGRVSLPEAGPVLVSGKTLGEVQDLVQKTLRTEFRDVSAEVSLSRLRTVRVYVVGDVSEPGAYDVSSLSTPLNALFAAGGVTSRGSLRDIKHYRGAALVQEVDAYDLLLRGVRGDLKRLENGDTLLVPPLGPVVTVDGAVRRPSIYELRGEKSLSDVLELAGGVLPIATLQHVEVQRLEAHQKRTMLTLNLQGEGETDSAAEELHSFSVHDGDEVHIFPITPYNQDAIYLQGHVIRPGRYAYKQGMKLSDIVNSYKDLLPEPAPRYAEIIRLKAPDFQPVVESFDLSKAMADPNSSPQLQPLDTVRIFSKYDFEAAPSVWVGGEVRVPGEYRTSGQIRLRDAVYLANGTTPDASLDSAQLFRIQDNGTLRIFSVNLRGALEGKVDDNIVLQPRDRLLVHRNIAQVEPATVYIKGEVAKPGRYPLTENMQVSDLIRTAGGLKRSADTKTADLTRYAATDPEHKENQQLAIPLADSEGVNSKDDLTLRDGDVVAIKQATGWNDLGLSVTVRGEVLHPGTFGIRPGERLSSVLARAGGYAPDAYPYAAVLMRREVREAQEKAQNDLVRRVEAEQVNMKFLPENDPEQKSAKLNALAQTHSTLEQLKANPPIGRVVIHIQEPIAKWQNTTADIAMREGDILVIPKKADYVMVNGQVFNPTAVSYQPGRSGNWYLSQAGGLTQLADKKAMFVLRADGSVLSAKNNSGWWSGDSMSSVLRPGDTVIVPEKALNVGNKNWTAILQFAQIAASAALTAAYLAGQ